MKLLWSSCPQILTYFAQARNALAALADAAATYDADGIDVYFLNSQKEGKRMKVPSIQHSSDITALLISVVPPHKTECCAGPATIQQCISARSHANRRQARQASSRIYQRTRERETRRPRGLCEAYQLYCRDRWRSKYVSMSS